MSYVIGLCSADLEVPTDDSDYRNILAIVCPIAGVALIAIAVIVIGCLVMMKIRRMNYRKTRKQYYDHADGCRKQAADKDLSDQDREGYRNCAEEDEKRARIVPDEGELEEDNGQLQEYQARDDDLDCAWKDEGGACIVTVTDEAESEGEKEIATLHSKELEYERKLEAKLATAGTTKWKHKERLKTLTLEKEELVECIDAKQREVDALSKDVNKLTMKLEGAKRELSFSQGQLELKSAQLDEFQQELQLVQDQREKLEKQLQMQEKALEEAASMYIKLTTPIT